MRSKAELIDICRTMTTARRLELERGPKTPDGHAVLATWREGVVGLDGVWRHGTDRSNPIASDTPGITAAIEAAAKQASRTNVAAMNDALVALLELGAKFEDLEVVSMPSRGPGAWTIRHRRKVCECGRAL